jgi:cell division septum initiation protein DivIVA
MTEIELLEEENRKLKEQVKSLEQELRFVREESGHLILEAKERCHEMEVNTREKCNRLERETEKKIDKNWEILSDRLEDFFQEHNGMREMLRPDIEQEDEVAYD